MDFIDYLLVLDLYFLSTKSQKMAKIGVFCQVELSNIYFLFT